MPPYIWMPPVYLDATMCLDDLHMFGCPTVCLDAAKCMVASKGMRDIQTYGGCPNIQGHLNIWHHPNVWGHMDPPKSDKAFFVLYMYSRHPNIFQTYGGIQTYGNVHTFRGHPNIGVPKHTGEYPNIWGSKQRVSKHGGHPHRGLSKHTGDASK